jgi:hypothetical protein
MLFHILLWINHRLVALLVLRLCQAAMLVGWRMYTRTC